jgi:hypothetical protein
MAVPAERTDGNTGKRQGGMPCGGCALIRMTQAWPTSRPTLTGSSTAVPPTCCWIRSIRSAGVTSGGSTNVRSGACPGWRTSSKPLAGTGLDGGWGWMLITASAGRPSAEPRTSIDHCGTGRLCGVRSTRGHLQCQQRRGVRANYSRAKPPRFPRDSPGRSPALVPPVVDDSQRRLAPERTKAPVAADETSHRRNLDHAEPGRPQARELEPLHRNRPRRLGLRRRLNRAGSWGRFGVEAGYHVLDVRFHYRDVA